MISLALALLAAPTAPVQWDEENASDQVVAVRAGTIHVVAGDRTVTDGTLLVRDGRVVAVGTDVEVPPGARVVDYGAHAVLVPGLVAPDSDLAAGDRPDRTANPGLRAVDGYDAFGRYDRVLAGGVTSTYVTPARARLISGQAAVVKLAGDDPKARVLADPVAIDGSIAREARSVPDYWRLPLPGTVDVGIGRPLAQLPQTTMGAILAYQELLDGVAAGVELEPYGPTAVGRLAPLVEAGLPWRITADETHEIRALLDLAAARGLTLVIEGAQGAVPLAEELAERGVGVVFEVPFVPNRSGIDRGKGEDARWPDLTVASQLVEKGVRVAIDAPAGMPLADLRLAAVLARRGGMSADAALRAVTLTPAELYGVADRVGSLRPGRDADFAVFTGHPMELGSIVTATWVGGELVYEAGAGEKAGSGPGRAAEAGPRAAVVRAGEIHVGDGEVIAPGEVLVVDGRIVEVGARVARPGGAVTIEVPVLMPGIVDAMGRLGLDGRRGTPEPGYDLTRLLEPGDATDRRVARSGITTVVLDSPGMSRGGAPLMAYRPAARDLDHMVVDATAAIRLSWPDNDRRESGRMVRSLLEKALEYREEWEEYRQELAEWEPEEQRPEFELPGQDDEDEEAEEEEEEEDEEEVDEDATDPNALTGIWVGEAVLEEAEGEDDQAVTERLRLQVRLTEAPNAEGWLRFGPLSDELVRVEGTYGAEEGTFSLSGLAPAGPFSVSGTLSDVTMVPEEPVTFDGRLVGGPFDVTVTAERTSRDYPVAERPTPEDPDEAQEEDDPRGKPREPRSDPVMEQFLRALDGEVAVLCYVERADEIVDCVDAFAQAGIRPVLLGASQLSQVADRVRDRVSGVLPSHTIVADGETVDDVTNRYAQLQADGFRVAFYSAAEEGAVDLPLMATYAVAKGMSPSGALRALTADAAAMLAIDDRVGRIARGLAADLVALSAPPFDPTAEVLRVWVAGREVR